MDYKKLAEDILAKVCGEENISGLTHCATRLRFNLKDEGKAQTEALKKVNGVMGVISKGGQYQVVIGSDVASVYRPLTELCEVCLLYTSRQIAAELIREKALRLLSDEIPHGIAVTIEKMTERKNGMMDIEATIVCERDSHKGIIIGKGGAMLKRIGSAARREIEDLMDTQVNLQIWVKVRKEWRDSELYMKNYGYNEKEI